MNHITQPIDFSVVQEFVNQFQVKYPHLSLLITLDEVANYLEQPHIKQWDCNPDKELVQNFKLGIFSHWVMEKELVEVSF